MSIKGIMLEQVTTSILIRGINQILDAIVEV